MGWLQELAADSDFKSFRQVAKAMKESSGSPWPAADTRAWTTVATKLGALDKGEDVDWWMSTGAAFLPALAFVLGSDEADLREKIVDAAVQGDGGTAAGWTFSMFPALRFLDLRSEKPFPGVPTGLTRKGGPPAQRTWWVAPSGAGKTLVGRWLEAQYGWTYVEAPDWVTALRELPQRGRVFLELASAADAPLDALQYRDELRLCVACPSRPPAAEPEESEPGVFNLGRRARRRRHVSEDSTGDMPNWEVVSTALVGEWIEPLIDWAAARVRAGGGFDAAKLRRLFAEPEFRVRFHTPGGALEFFGIVEEVGLDALEAEVSGRQDPLRFVRVWFKAALSRSDRERPPGIETALRKEGAPLLLDLCKARLRAGLGEALSEDEWAGLMPLRLAPSLDRDRLMQVVEQGGSDLQERLRNELLPDGRSLFRGLVAAGALGPGPDRYEIRPQWVAALVADQALHDVYKEGWHGIGCLLLSNETAETTLEQMISEVAAAKLDAVRCCLDANVGTPEGAAAIDGAIRAMGLAAALGHPTDSALAKAVWVRQQPTLIRRYPTWPPFPLASVRLNAHHRGVTAIGAWLLAVLALGAQPALRGQLGLPSSLDPWSKQELQPAELECLAEALAIAQSSFSAKAPADEETSLREAVYRIGGEVLKRYGVLQKQSGQLVDAQFPDLLVALASGRDLGLSERETSDLLQLRFDLHALRAACTRQDRDLAMVLHWCWNTWGSAQSERWALPPFGWPHRHSEEELANDVTAVWSAASPDQLSDDVLSAAWTTHSVWTHLPPAIWIRLVEFRAGAGSDGERETGPFQAMPTEVLILSLRAGLLGPWSQEIGAVFWNRIPDEVLAYVDELVLHPWPTDPRWPWYDGPAFSLVRDAPLAQHGSLLARAAIWVADPTGHPGAGAWVWRWLVEFVQRGGPAWRQAYTLLHEHRDAVARALPAG